MRCEELRILCLLLRKNYSIRKRYMCMNISEIMWPVLITGLVIGFTSSQDIKQAHINEYTHFPITTRDQLIEDHVKRFDLQLHYKPQNEFTNNLMRKVTDRCMDLGRRVVQGLHTEDELLVKFEMNRNITILAIDFYNTAGQNVPKTLDYTIRSSIPFPNTLLISDDASYISDTLIVGTPVVPLQMCLDDAFIDIAAPERSYKPKVVIQKMPHPPHHTVALNIILGQIWLRLFGGLMFANVMHPTAHFVSAEKICGVNALLRINGVKSYQNLFSWLLIGMLFSAIPVSAVTALVKLELMSGKIAFYQYSNWSVIWLALFLNVTHLHAFSLHTSSYCPKPCLATWVPHVVAIVIAIITGAIEDTTIYYVAPYLNVFCPTIATRIVFHEIGKHENTHIGAHWSNIMDAASPTLDVMGSLGYIMVFSLLGTVFHFVLAVYVDAVLPNKYGVHKSAFFFLNHLKTDKMRNNDGPTQRDSSEGRPKILEPVAEGAFVPGIELRNLAKSFTRGCCRSRQAVEAVRGVSIDFYKGQITALLGHNGAGKTTILSILTGLTASTRGTVYINGKDLSKDLDEIRSDLGVCPQENTVFPFLTVQEQVTLVGLLKQKNRTRAQVIQDVDDLLQKLEISGHRHFMPGQLSGGQQRRLCLAMALVGNASTLFLDEPTSGMDPEGSRKTWDIILKLRQQKTIIITTHRMEEADVLGDRIAIMDSGRVKCYGTPMFLKKHYGHNRHEITLSTTPRCNETKVREIVGSEAKVNTTHRGRIVVTLPLTSSLPKLLDNIESQKAALGITGVSVSTMTLEAMFLKAAEEEETGESIDDVDGSEEPPTRSYEYLTGSNLTVQRIQALLTKKLTNWKNEKSLPLTIDSRTMRVSFTAHCMASVRAILSKGGQAAPENSDCDKISEPSSYRENLTTTVLVIVGALIAVVFPVLANTNFYSSDTQLIRLGSYRRPETLIYSKDLGIGETYKKIVERQGGTGSIVKGKNSLTSELLARATLDPVYYKNRIIISAEFNSSSIANGFYTGGAIFSAPITVNAMSNLVLKRAAGEEYSIVAQIGNLPRSLTDNATDENGIWNIGAPSVWGAYMFLIVFFPTTALFLQHPFMENSMKIKQLQQMAGVSSFLYWGTMFAVDYVFYTAVTMLTVFWLYILDVLTGSNNIRMREVCILLVLFLIFGINLLLIAYIHSFLRGTFHDVLACMISWPMLFGTTTTVLHQGLRLVENSENANTLQRTIFSLHPATSFMFAYRKFAEIASSNARCRSLSNGLIKAACAVGDRCCDFECYDGYCANPLPYIRNFSEEGGLEKILLYLLLVPIILVDILCLLEHQACAKLKLKYRACKKKSIGPNQYRIIDSQVAEEESIVRQAVNERASERNQADENVFLALGLSKRYGKLEAVKEVSFRVKENECFGLLGVNGAGKSTTFRMLVGEEIPTTGILYCGSHSIKFNRTEYLGRIGYCPQNDALIPCFDAIEHLSLLAALRGVPESEIRSEIDMWIDKLQLGKHARKPSETYSGGNKRRLNIAMAVIAGPKIVMLDEPTTGVDPAARRLVWTVLQSCQAAGQAIILTSHSMEECETLCDRLVVMAKGRLLCVGASQELKERFGAGFNISVKLNPERSDLDFQAVKDSIETAFTCKLEDEHPGHLFYHITDPTATWVKMFGTMNGIRSNYTCVEDFTVSTSTLEQLFMQFARANADTHKESQAPSQSTADPIDV